jgi:hypothetical protein
VGVVVQVATQQEAVVLVLGELVGVVDLIQRELLILVVEVEEEIVVLVEMARLAALAL